MDEITISVSKLFKMIKELRRGGMDFVTLSMLDAEDEFPACVSFEATSRLNPHVGVGYGEIEAVSE